MSRLSILLLISIILNGCVHTNTSLKELESVQVEHVGNMQDFELIDALESKNIAVMTARSKEIEARGNLGAYSKLALCEYYLITGKIDEAGICIERVIEKVERSNQNKMYLERFIGRSKVTDRSWGWHIAAWPSHILAHANFVLAKIQFSKRDELESLDTLRTAQKYLSQTLERGGYRSFHVERDIETIEHNNSNDDFLWQLDGGETITVHGRLIGTSAHWQEDFFSVPTMAISIAKHINQPVDKWLQYLNDLDLSKLVSHDGLIKYEKEAYLRIANANLEKYSAIKDGDDTFFDSYNNLLDEKEGQGFFRDDYGSALVANKLLGGGTPLIGSLISVRNISQLESLSDIGRLKRKQGLKLLEKLAIARKNHVFNEHDVAKLHYRQLLEDPFLGLMPEIAWQAHYHHGHLLMATGEHSEAIENWQRAISLIDQLRGKNTSGLVSILNTASTEDPYVNVVNALINEGRLPEAYRYMEKSKSRKLMDALINVSLKDKDQKTIKIFEKLKKQLRYFQNENNEKSFNRTLDKVKSFSKELQTNEPALYDLLTAGDAQLGTVQSKLTDDETLIAFYEALGEMYAFVVHKDSIEVKKVDNNDLPALIKNYRNDISIPENVDPSSREYLKSASKLYDHLIRPIEPLIKGKTLTIVPHGALHYLPFNTLYDGKQYLIERFPVRNLPTSSALVFLENQQSNTEGLVALGNPTMDLPAAELEARLIAIQTNGELLLRQQATETSFREKGRLAKILHVASHGEFNPSDPLASRILLAKDDKHDGNITARELYSMELKNDLVTLSGCETGLGDITDGDDVVGLSRALLFAGASSIVTSLWKVEDQATTQLMIEFYGSLGSTDRMSSLRDAQLIVKNEYKEHPFFWAAFQLTGLIY